VAEDLHLVEIQIHQIALYIRRKRRVSIKPTCDVCVYANKQINHLNYSELLLNGTSVGRSN
jgi:hypothetical protein